MVGVRVIGSATLVVSGVTSGVILSVRQVKGIPIHVLHQGVRVGVVVGAIVIVVKGEVEAEAEEVKGSAFTSLTTVTAAMDKRVSGNTSKVTIVR